METRSLTLPLFPIDGEFLCLFFLSACQIIQMLREYLNLMGQSEAKERLEHISTQLEHTRTKEQVRPHHSVFNSPIQMDA